MFDNNQVSSSQEAYLLGLLYADGYITSQVKDKYYILGISLKAEDKDFLQKVLDIFNKELNASYGLKFVEKTNSYSFAIGNVKLIEHLRKDLGLVENKSYDTSSFVFTNIPDKYKRDFILGFWDGDGSFSSSGDERHRNLASVVSNNKALLEAIIVYINQELGADFCKLKDKTVGDPYYRIRFTDNKAKIFGDWLYKDKTFYLERKYNKYLNFKPVKGKAHKGFNNPKTKGILCLDSGKVYVTAKDCCLGEFGIDNPGAINSIRMVCRGEREATRDKHFRYLTEEEKLRWIENGSI